MRGGELLHLERREKAVVDALLQRINVNGIAEIPVGIDVVGAPRRGGHAELHRGREIFENSAPVAFVVGTAAMTLIDDDKIEKVGRVVAEIRRGIAVLVRAAHEGLEDGEEHGGVLGDAAALTDFLGLDANPCAVFSKSGKGVVGLVGQDIAIGQEQDARSPRRLARHVPAALEQSPGDLKGDGGLAGAGRQRQQDALLAGGDRFQRVLDGIVLIVPRLPSAAALLERHGGETVAPSVRRLEHLGPQLVRRRIVLDIALLPGLHVDAIDTPAIGGEGKARLQFLGIGLGLRHALGRALVLGLGLDHRQLVVAEGENIVGYFRLAPPPGALDTTRANRFTANPTIRDHAPPCFPQRRVNQFGAGLGLVHSAASLIACDGGEVSSPEKAFCRMDCFSATN